MRSLSSMVKDLPVEVVSAVVVESAARFSNDSVVQLLSPQSAMNHLLSRGTLCHLFNYFLFLIFSCYCFILVTLSLFWSR